MLNRIIIMGRLVRDPELRNTQSGTAVTSFTLAVDRDFKDQNGEKGTDFIDVVAWRHTAEFVCKYLAKGRMAIAEGRLQIREWTDNNGNKRRNAEIVAENVYFGDSKKEESNSGGYGYGAPAGYGATPGYGAAPSYGAAPGNGGYGGGENSYRPAGAPVSVGFEEIADDDGDLPF